MLNELGLKIDIEGLRHSVMHIFASHTRELQEMINKSLEEKLQLSWVRDEINLSVENCIRSAITDIANDYKLKTAITRAISDQLCDVIDKRSSTE